MADSIAHDVVKEAQSVGDHLSPADNNATPSNKLSAGNGQATTDDQLHLSNHDVNEKNAGANDAHGATSSRGLVGDLHVLGEIGVGSHGASAEGTASGMSESMAQALADASGGSDTDTSRTGATDSHIDGKGHTRTGSVKKPASFKAVSVTKSFLAKSLSASPVPRVSDKGVASSPSPISALQSAKPRLVAKSALGGMGKSLTKMNGAGGPDASKVWNKNQRKSCSSYCSGRVKLTSILVAAPTPAPRQFTDEELQTRYGIHMTARLQSDEAGKDSKWADIDDDEDDWAPETVEWMDGTKSNVATSEAQVPPVRQADRAPTPSSIDKPHFAVARNGLAEIRAEIATLDGI